jgi:thioredoxin 1
MRVKELRQELASRNLRWAGLLEKEDLVQAVFQAREKAAHFSSTGLMTPGQVVTLTGIQVQQEVHDTTIDTPLVVDAFATWCGPCQMVQPQLQAAAEQWGDTVRVAKFDTDQFPNEASLWHIQGLPTFLLFHKGKLVARIEGALMKDQLLSWVEQELAKVA